MKKTIYTSAIVGLLLACTGCGGKDRTESDSSPLLAVSVEPQRYLLEQIAGDRFTVRSLIPPGSNPETYEADLRTRADLDRAEAYFYVGALPLEQAMLATTSTKSYNSAAGIQPLYGTHSHGDQHEHGNHHDHDDGLADPHVWASVRNSRTMAANMLRALIEINPADSSYFRQRFKHLDHQLDSLDHNISARLGHAPNRAFMVWHPSLGYFARDYGLNQLAVGWEAKEPSAAQLRRVVQQADSMGIRIFFHQQDFDTRQAQSLTDELKLKQVSINPQAYGYIDQLNLVADELTR